MAVERKYGRIELEHGTIGDDEPVIVFRGRDAVLPGVIQRYAQLCAAAGSPEHHMALIEQSRQEIIAWQLDHPHLVRVPRSDGYVERQSTEQAGSGNGDR